MKPENHHSVDNLVILYVCCLYNDVLEWKYVVDTLTLYRKICWWKNIWEVVPITPHIVRGSTLWFLSNWWRFAANTFWALDWLGGIHLHGAPSLHGIGLFDEGFWLRESQFSLGGWLCLLVWWSSYMCLPCGHTLIAHLMIMEYAISSWCDFVIFVYLCCATSCVDNGSSPPSS